MNTRGRAALDDGAPAQPMLARLRAIAPSLSEAEQRVANAFARNAVDLIHLPLKTLTEQIGVSDATIIRCCQSLGYRGLRDFKLALAAETLAPHRVIHEAVSPSDDIPTITSKVLRSDMQAIADTLAVIDTDALARAIQALLVATRIECYGIGSSVPIALDAYYRMIRIGLPATIATDPHMQAVSAAHLPPGAVAFAISHTGQSAETYTALQQAKQANATCILLTSYAHTPMSTYADIELITAAPQSALRPEAVAVRITHLCVVDAISVALAMHHPEAARDALMRDEAIIAEREVAEGSHAAAPGSGSI